jgi:predicted TPR repeat methyltransferase
MDVSVLLSEADARSLARQKLDEGVPLAARKLLEPFLRSGTDSWETHALFGQACIDSNELTEALELMERQPADDGSEAARSARLRVAQIMLLSGRDIEAIDRLAELAMAKPGDRDVVETLGFALLQQGDADRALTLFGALCREFPLTPRLAVGMMKALAAQGNFDAGLEFAEEANRIIPRHSGIMLQWAEMLMKARRLDEAEEKLRFLLREAGPTKDVLVQLATIALMRDRAEEARKLFRTAHRIDPKDFYLKHLGAAESGKAGERADDTYVAGLFDGYARKFESSLLSLGYRVPGLIHNLVRERMGGTEATVRVGDMLDLGCGTGLLGLVLHEMKAGFWQGVDLSAQMIEEARGKGIYDDLVTAEITAHLKSETREWDCVFAADVFCYFGDLSEVVRLVADRLRQGGFFAFTVEALPEGDVRGWAKNATGRYAHGEAYVRAAMSRFSRVEVAREVLRMDREAPIHGLLVSGFAP